MSLTTKRIFVICPVRNAPQEVKQFLENYVSGLESDGYIVHLPHRDTNQVDLSGGLQICADNREAIKQADEVHLYWTPDSTGSMFDLGMAFMAGKPLIMIKPMKSFDIMLREWSKVGMHG